jgi:ABC-2 type transport system ATP-binding protein
MADAIATRNLSRAFGGRRVVDCVSLTVPQGAVYGFLGPNGAGKTTTIRLLLGLLRPEQGEIWIHGLAMPARRREIARLVGAMVEAPALYEHLSGFENLRLTQRVLEIAPSEITRVLEIVELRGEARRRVGGYSLGMRQRLAIARALLGQPKVLLLDEPTNGLDPAGIRDMRTLIRALPERENTTVLVSSHLLADVEQIASHVGLMHRGRLLAQAPLGAFLSLAGAGLEIGVRDASRAQEVLGAWGAVEVLGPDRLRLAGDSGAIKDAAAINARLHSLGFSVFELSPRAPSLEDIFLKLTAPPLEIAP